MASLGLLQLYISGQKSVNQSTLIEASLANTTQNNTKPQDGDISIVAVFLAHISFMIVWGILVYIVSSVCKALEDPPENRVQEKNEIISIKHIQQHPCRNCRFFHKNSYLKCAVNPAIALTKEALNCSDYSHK
ncbi:MAG: hypothetical protein RMZ41_000835 [Nostoc sp. DedVER02]|uniref:hypothetical protein n=1 Tax=unclassified Nostoc TaxID=2593658 RepID=UPI002AD25150|nr:MULTISPECIES: hypothetical protein [unclassified Nostoc]MDZ7988039.1 hypothetical protein [Nostoc sp. DedVER02]MDZ8114963.1 hypothetical protein [Nostoc sp. DedVER01b]